jgi:tRNA pseudouridine38-40 synthase
MIYRRNCEIKPGMVMPEDMTRWALAVEYNGAAFHGLQAQQVGVKTIQHELEAALSSIADEAITIIAAGRTDAGVHATAQIIHFDTLAVRPVKAWVQGANARLPRDVCIRWAKPVSETFHARFAARSRTYRYLIVNDNVRPALLADQITWFKRPLKIELMIAASRELLGEKDFSALRSAQCQAHSPVRRIMKIQWAQMGNFMVFEVQANAFLHHMVRNIMGMLLTIGVGDKPVEWLEEILLAGDRNRAAATAPAAGLYLVQVDYAAHFNLPNLAPGPHFLPAELPWLAQLTENSSTGL